MAMIEFVEGAARLGGSREQRLAPAVLSDVRSFALVARNGVEPPVGTDIERRVKVVLTLDGSEGGWIKV